MEKIIRPANLTDKQHEAWMHLTHENTQITELGFGGGAGGAKSWLGCLWVVSMCEAFPKVRFVIGRKELKRLKNTTLVTFFKVCEEYGFEAEKHYHYNSQDGHIKWWNGSMILLMDLANQPSDPLYLRLGSLEITGAFIDESNEILFQAIDILSTRIGRHLNKEYNIPAKLLETFNPDKGHIYRRYYKPWKEGTLPPYRTFIKALAIDNPYLPESYIEQLKRADKVTRERLLYGNFEYDDDPTLLFEYDDILDLFTNKPEKGEKKYISCDVARLGADKTVICLWEGLYCKKIWKYDKTLVSETIAEIIRISEEYAVKRSHIVIDEDGVGGGVVDGLIGCKGFVNNSRALKPYAKEIPNYQNLKTQCYFEFARLTKNGKIGIGEIESAEKDLIIGELSQVKQKDPDKDGKIALIGKETIKENIGRSPDFADALMMRMYFELKGTPILKPIFI